MHHKGSTLPLYLLWAAGLLLLAGTAFFGPKIIFAIQDDLRCRAVASVSREELDITSFGAGYERDPYKRLERFARGLADGVQYYVTVQELDAASEEARRKWPDELQRQGALTMLHYLAQPWEIYTYELLDWKRCIIYGDDFTSGVNFILQYMEIGVDGCPVLKLLMDEETGSLYAARSNYSALPGAESEAGLSLREYVSILWGVSDFELFSGMAVEYGIYFGRELGALPIPEIADVEESLMKDKMGGQ